MQACFQKKPYNYIKKYFFSAEIQIILNFFHKIT